MKKVLVVTAHPDDLENGIGGTLTLLSKAGFSITSVVATLPSDHVQGEMRLSESMKSHALIRAEPIFWDQPDGALEVNARLRRWMQSVYDNYQPDLVLTLWPADVHPDHRAIADLAMGPALQRGVNTELLCFEVCSSGRNSAEFRPQSIGFVPTHYVDTTAVQEEKRALMNCHQSQDPEGMWSGMRNVHANRARDARSLLSIKSVFAEGFVRLTRCGDLSRDLNQIFLRSSVEDSRRGIGVDFKSETIGISL